MSQSSARYCIENTDCDVDQVDKRGTTLLMRACKRTRAIAGDVELIRFLVACHANLMIVEDAPITVLDLFKRDDVSAPQPLDELDVRVVSILMASDEFKLSPSMNRFGDLRHEIEVERCNIAKLRAGLIRPTALTVCLALDALDLPLPVMISIIQQTCAPFAVCVRYAVLWDIAFAVRHFHRRVYRHVNLNKRKERT